MSTRLHLGLLAVAAGLGLAGVYLASYSLRLGSGALALAAVALLGAAGFTGRVAFRRRADARVAAADAAKILRALGVDPPADPVEAMSRSVDVLQTRLAQAESKLRDLTASREAALRESEERYALAVRGADDGMWEWDLKSGRMQFSPRWKALLGYSEDELTDRPDEWFGRIHPRDRDRVVNELQQHAEGVTARFESEHRLLHRDGQYRWILARGAAVHHASGRPYRVVGLHTDITARKQVQESLIELADSLSDLRGEECLKEMARRFAEVLGVREVFVTECCNYQPTTRLRMLARWDGGDFGRCVEFDMEGTSCEEVIRTGKPLQVAEHLGDRWPREREYCRESYLGLPCLDARGRVIGNIACADDHPMRRDLPHFAILKIFAIRAAVELERRQLERMSTSPMPGAASAPVTPAP